MRLARVLLTLVAVIALCAAGSPAARAEASPGDDERLRQLTSAFAALDATDLRGRRWTAADLSGRVVILDFWATWCAPCLAEIPVLRRIHSTFDRDRVQVLGVSLDVTDRRSLTAWLNRQRIEWPQIWQDAGYEGELARRFGVRSLPASLLVGSDGRVMAQNLRGERLHRAVAALLEEKR
jgi:thiol-disulfide isomerase/thioredoxin